jgi:hypothetical protein
MTNDDPMHNWEEVKPLCDRFEAEWKPLSAANRTVIRPGAVTSFRINPLPHILPINIIFYLIDMPRRPE